MAPPHVSRWLLPFDRGVLAGASVLGVVVAVDIGSGVQLSGAYATGAIVASMLTTSRRTAGVAAAAFAAALLGGLLHDNAGSRDWLFRAGICLTLAALAVVSAESRGRRETRLRRMTVIAETAQRAVLRAMPSAVGSVGFAAPTSRRPPKPWSAATCTRSRRRRSASV